MAILLLNSDIQAKAAMLVETVSNILKSNVSVQIIRDPHTTHTHIPASLLQCTDSCYKTEVHPNNEKNRKSPSFVLQNEHNF